MLSKASGNKDKSKRAHVQHRKSNRYSQSKGVSTPNSQKNSNQQNKKSQHNEHFHQSGNNIIKKSREDTKADIAQTQTGSQPTSFISTFIENQSKNVYARKSSSSDKFSSVKKIAEKVPSNRTCEKSTFLSKFKEPSKPVRKLVVINKHHSTNLDKTVDRQKKEDVEQKIPFSYASAFNTKSVVRKIDVLTCKKKSSRKQLKQKKIIKKVKPSQVTINKQNSKKKKIK